MAQGFTGALAGLDTCEVETTTLGRSLDDWGIVRSDPATIRRVRAFISYKEDKNLSLDEKGTQGISRYRLLIPNQSVFNLNDQVTIDGENYTVNACRFDKRACITRVTVTHVSRRALNVTD